MSTWKCESRWQKDEEEEKEEVVVEESRLSSKVDPPFLAVLYLLQYTSYAIYM